MTRTGFKTGSHRVSIGRYAAPSEFFSLHARNEVSVAAVSVAKADAPAFALAVLEAAGYTTDNSCAGDAVRSLKFQIANEARAAEEAQLDKEAEALARTHWDAQRYLFNWPKETSTFKDLWLNVARKARELHKPVPEES